MKRVERVKIFTGEDTDELEKKFADWHDGVVTERDAAPITKGQPVLIRERSLVIRNYEGEETYALAVFYEGLLIAETETGKDRGGHLKGGVSMVTGRG